MKIIGSLSISKGVLCKKEVLGNIYPGKISGIDFNIAFPSLSVNHQKEVNNTVGMCNPLVAPSIGPESTIFNEKVIWGHPLMAPSMNSFVENVAIEVECCELTIDEITEKLYTGAKTWADSFKSFLQLITKQQLERKMKGSNCGDFLQLFCEGKYIENKQPYVLYANFYNDKVFASSEDIKQAIAFASSGKELILEYQMLLSAYKAQKNNKNRQAIIDACSAIEICLTNWIKNFANKKGFNFEILTDKYRSLGERFKLVSRLDPSFPSLDFNNIIIKPRNNVAHNRDIYPSNECTVKLIEMVENYLNYYHTVYY